MGAGAAGLFAAIQLDERLNVLILEKKSKPGMKLLMSGAGRCNITNSKPIREFLEHYNDKKRFIQHAIHKYTNTDLIKLLNTNRINTTIDKNGKVFPASQSAKDVLNLFLYLCKRNKVEIKYSSPIINTDKQEELFTVRTEQAEYKCKHLIIASGGRSYPTTGSTGDGYSIANSFGHNIIPPKPALTPVFIEKFKFASISGISLNDRTIDLYRNNKKIHSHIGDILFTHKGLSGPGILDFSRYFEIGDQLRINLIDIKSEECNAELIELAQSQGAIQIKTALKRWNLPENLILILLEEAGIIPDKKISEISKAARIRIVNLLTACPFSIDRIGGYNIAMTTAGGIDTKEINPKTLMSNLIPNLFCIGEVLDIDADTGGYSLQAAFSTAYSAVTYINSSLS